MANSGSVVTNTLKHSNYYLNWQIASQNTAGNYTDINWQVGINANNDYWYLNAMKINSVVINGTTVFSGGTYSNIEGGSHQLASGTARIYHNSDGRKSFSASISGWLYSYGNCSGTGSWDLTPIPRYLTINTFNIKNITETTAVVDWTVSDPRSGTYYSLDNGATWIGSATHGETIGSDNKSGTFNIKDLKANTTYNIKIKVSRTDSGLWTESSIKSFSTYNYPHCTDSPNFTIGNALTIKFYNPLSRNLTWKILGNNNYLIASSTTTNTSYTGINSEATVNNLYASIPNAKSGTYKVEVTYGSSTITRNNNNTYSIKGTEVPAFTNFTYKDTNTNVTNVTGNNQVLVKGLSTLQVGISSTNKMVAQKSSTASKYIATIDTLNKNVNYSTSDINLDVGTVINAGTKRLTVTAYDSRTLFTSVNKDITVYDYTKPVINGSITRLNNFEKQTTIKVSGTYTKLTVGGADKNTISKVQYRYRETNGTWSNWVTLNTTVTSGKFTCNDVILSLDNTKSFDFEIQAIDKLQTTTSTINLDVGQAIFFISTNNKTCYINGNEVATVNDLPKGGVARFGRNSDLSLTAGVVSKYTLDNTITADTNGLVSLNNGSIVFNKRVKYATIEIYSYNTAKFNMYFYTNGINRPSINSSGSEQKTVAMANSKNEQMEFYINVFSNSDITLKSDTYWNFVYVSYFYE